MNDFITSMPAQAAARCIIETARSMHMLEHPIAVSNELAEAEKNLIIKMFQKMDEFLKTHPDELSADEITNLFTFVFAKAAEAVTNMFNHKEQSFEMTGMFDGRVPLYAAFPEQPSEAFGWRPRGCAFPGYGAGDLLPDPGETRCGR